MVNNLNLLQLFILLNSVSEHNYLVGGCVRDMLLEKTPHDFDIVTNVPMDKIEEIFVDNGWKVNAVGKQFLVMFVSKNDEEFEIANFRKEIGFSDGRRPDSVSIGDLQSDSQRRDFTINSIYFNPMTGEFLDPNNGRKDIENKILKFIGKPRDRIKEDYLRIFRFYRFLLTTGFQADSISLRECRSHFIEAHGKITPERIRAEIEKMAGL